MASFICVSAVVFRNESGEVLTVRKRGTKGFMLPGGKPEEGEGAAATAIREVYEELRLKLTKDDIEYMGTYVAPALNEAGFEVRAHVFEWQPVDTGSFEMLRDLSPAAEIEEVLWVHPETGDHRHQAPLNTESVFPKLEKMPLQIEEPAAKNNQPRKALAVFLGSSKGNDPHYAQIARQLGGALAEQNIALVYGGGRAGLMGELANGAHEAGGTVYGIIPRFMVEKEQAHTGISNLEIVADMHERKSRMATLADAFVALPGGPGTLEEFFEVWTWNYLQIHRKPVILLNVDGFWDPLLAMISSMQEAGFVNPVYMEKLKVVESVDGLLNLLSK